LGGQQLLEKTGENRKERSGGGLGCLGKEDQKNESREMRGRKKKWNFKSVIRGGRKASNYGGARIPKKRFPAMRGDRKCSGGQSGAFPEAGIS